jgi:ferritin-like protein
MYHEPTDELSAEVRDMHRALQSLKEEVEAIDWYNQRIETCSDKELKTLLEHNRDEEKEHAAMLLEWIRRKDTEFTNKLKEWMFTDKPLQD